MKSNFKKSQRWAPKTNKKRVIHQSSTRSLEPVKTKPLDIEAIKKAQEIAKEKANEEINEESSEGKNNDSKK